VRAEGGTAVVHVGDHTSAEDCNAMAAAARRELGGVDVLYNGVGIAGPRAAPANTEPDEWDQVMDLNLKGMFLTARSIVPLMVEQDSGGSIVLISSAGAVGGLSWVPTAYGVSKAGVNRLVSSLAAAYAPHDIRCNGIMPGLIDTPMAIDSTIGKDGRTPAGLTRDEYAAHRETLVPMRYKGSAMDVAFAALYFASDESRYVSGAVLPVDGALLAR
jgi:NAD(P)-dependent dehydrogenase (short-subunit alcohol dehydrogenase family)